MTRSEWWHYKGAKRGMKIALRTPAPETHGLLAHMVFYVARNHMERCHPPVWLWRKARRAAKHLGLQDGYNYSYSL